MKTIRSVSSGHAVAVAYVRVLNGVEIITKAFFLGDRSWLRSLDSSRLSLDNGSNGSDWILGQLGISCAQLLKNLGWSTEGNDGYLALTSMGLHFLNPADRVIVPDYPQDPDCVTDDILLRVWKDVIVAEDKNRQERGFAFSVEEGCGLASALGSLFPLVAEGAPPYEKSPDEGNVSTSTVSMSVWVEIGTNALRRVRECVYSQLMYSTYRMVESQIERIRANVRGGLYTLENIGTSDRELSQLLESAFQLRDRN